MTDRQANFTECEYPNCKCPRYGRCGNAAEQEAIAKLLWHRFGDSSVEEWEDETHKAKFLEAADDVLFRARSRQGATLLPGEMQSAIRAWLQCSIDKRPSAAALGQRIAEIASTVTSQPFFLTQWEREDYERRQRGEPELGPGGSAVSPADRATPTADAPDASAPVRRPPE